MIKELINCNDPLLKSPLADYVFTEELESVKIAHILAQNLIHHQGLGLAANQIGMTERAIAIIGEKILVMFNPKIVDFSEESLYMEEGCLSYPNLFIKIKRPRQIRVRYTEPNGNIVTNVYEGLTSRIIQHEIDHLNGIRFVERATRIHLEQARKKMGKNLDKPISAEAKEKIEWLKN